ncbi:LOW QUALITY PROTEIN: uncharacterized protein LOC129583287 [Paramacrobiotus metropolitanus]|uniref:LOW QUALITY PROTEIN: uncharacterized protein LOC129583287 n=1 Tax=Paramacrobiotus metropolitanus TaxID=2943436 RepID=UPI002445880C|nr:LOW QUALITY PROTEIN: uncharacterized protein LOC129583287 [Paramacrobiotus metropolitanus]
MESLFVYATVLPNVWKKIRVEILGNFPPTPDGHRYLIFAVDTCTYWTEARALPESSPEAIARFLLSLYFRFGRCEISVSKQKYAVCQKVAECFRELLQQHDIHPATPDTAVLRHTQYGVDQLFVLQDRGADAGVTTGGMALDKNGLLIGCADMQLPPSQAALFTDADPLNPIPQYPSLKNTKRSVIQRSTTTVNPTNLDTDFLSFVSANPTNWDVKLEGFLYNLRTAVAVCNKGYSAHHLMLGRNPVPVTGRELIVRSLTGIHEVFRLLNHNEKSRKSKENGKETDSERKALWEVRRSSEVVSSNQKAYNLRSRGATVPDSEVIVAASVDNEKQQNGAGVEKKKKPQRKKLQKGKSKKKVAKTTADSQTTKKSKNRRKRKRADILKVKCPECPNTYVTCQEELDLHLECHTVDEGSGERLFKCRECGKICKIWLNMVRHLGHHRDISTFRKLPNECYTCKHCGKEFKVPECLREHVRVVHEGQKRFECHICHEKFKVYKTKMRHMDLKHANITYNCRDCHYKTKVRRNLKLHMEKHEKKRKADQERAEPPEDRMEDIPLPVNNGVNHVQPSEPANPVTHAAPLPVGSSSRLGPFHRMHAASLSHPEPPPPPVSMPCPWSGGNEAAVQHANMPVIYFTPPAGPSNPNGAFVAGNHAELMPGFMQMGMSMPPFQQTVFTVLSPSVPDASLPGMRITDSGRATYQQLA